MPELTFLTIADFKIQEPTTAFTDLIITAQCYWFAWKLRAVRANSRLTQIFWWYFILMGTSSLIGGIVGHGIYYMLDPRSKLIGHAFIGSAIYCLQRVSIESYIPYWKGNWKRITEIAVLVQLLVFLSVITFSEEIHFNAVRNHSALGLVGMVLPMQYWAYRKDGRPARKWMYAGILWSLAPAIVYSLELSFSKWFNYYDLGHVLLLGTFYCFFRAAHAFGEAAQRPNPSKLASA